MFPSAAGEYEYTRRALPEWVAFVIGWTMIVGLVVAAATVSVGFGRYARYFLEIDVRVAALGLLATVSMVAMGGVKQSARLTVGLSAVQVGDWYWSLRSGRRTWAMSTSSRGRVLLAFSAPRHSCSSPSSASVK